MKRIIYSLIFLFAFSFNLFAQTEEVLLSVGNHQISKAEFEHIYKKNNNNLYNQADKKTPSEYLDLFINFKLKVVQAESLKMDTSKSFINELAGYRKEIAAPYLTDVKYEDKLVHELYRRMQNEVNASHILLRLDKNATPEQDTETLAKITSIRQEIITGKDFGEAAVEYSQDPSAKTNKGNLSYFSAFMMVAPFEDAAFTTSVGEVSQPIKSDFGYHLIFVHDVRKNKGEIQVAHIMRNTPKDATVEDRKRVKSEIDTIYEQLKSGADFTKLAKKESQDKRSAVKGGEMPWFATGRIVPEFSNAAFSLKNIGDYTKPIETKFGYHIIKKLNERTVPPFEEAKPDIEAKIKKDAARRTSSKKVFIEKLKKEYNFTVNAEAKQKFVHFNFHDSIIHSNEPIFTLDNKNYSTKELEAFVAELQLTNGSYVSIYDRWVNDEITEFENSKLEEKYPEFRYLMNEYHDGILLFNISQEKIWDYAAKDTVGLENFFIKNKTKHKWGERFKGTIITCESAEVREKAEDLFGAEMSNEEVAEHLNTEKEVISFEEGAWEEGRNEVVDYYVWNGKEPEDFDSATTFIRGDKIEPEIKQLNEARGLYISDYQNHLEEKWLKKLRGKHKVKVNKKMLKTIAGV